MPTTEYNKKMNIKAKMTRASPELWKYHNIKNRMTHTGFEYKCDCCHDEEEKWMSEWEAKKHINTKKHEGIHQYYRQSIEMEKKYKEAQKKIKELEKKLFEGKFLENVNAFLDECEHADTIIIEEETQERLASGTYIKNIKQWEGGISSFDDLYIAFCKWSSSSFKPDDYKEQIKKSMIEYQERVYGAEFGEYERNGTYEEPRFDFKHP